MIRELRIKDPELTPVTWWPKVEAFKGRNLFEFGPGLTVLWGPNGCGKSSLLRTLARLTHCEQGGTPCVTADSLRELREGFGLNASVRDGAKIVGDGKPVHFLDPTAEAGLVGGGAGFDYDFLQEGVQSMFLRRTSAGQQVTAKMNRILESASKLKEVSWKVPRVAHDKKEQKILDRCTAALRPSPKVAEGPPTLLLDEPDRSISIPRQADLWDILSRQQRFQIIVATHSPFALALGDHVQYVDIEKNYLAECLAHLDILGRRVALK